MIIRYSRGNTLFYLRNNSNDPIYSRVVAMPDYQYKESVSIFAEKLTKHVDATINSVRFIVLEMNHLEQSNIDDIDEVRDYLEDSLNTQVIMTNDIMEFDYDMYLAKS